MNLGIVYVCVRVCELQCACDLGLDADCIYLEVNWTGWYPHVRV